MLVHAARSRSRGASVATRRARVGRLVWRARAGRALALACAWALAACAASAPVDPGARTASAIPQRSPASSSLVAAFDLPREARSRELSGIAWDSASRRLFAISDHTRQIVSLIPNERFDAWTFGETIALAVPEPWDGEGVALEDGGFIVANEEGPHLYRVGRDGALRGEIQIPAHYAYAVENASLESLSLSPDGRYLFTCNERALRVDGPAPTTAAGSVVRLLRLERATGARSEYAYRTDPIFAAGANGEIGVSDVAALSGTELLVMERAYVPSAGNQIRLYRVSLADAADVAPAAELGPDTKSLVKSLVVDLADLPREDLRDGGGPHALFANYEGIALGPRLADGRRLVFLASDDNGSLAQSARLLTLALAGLP